MKKKINTYLLLTVFLTLVATLVMAVAIFHHMYREQVIEDMQTYAQLLGSMADSGEELKERYTGQGAKTIPEATAEPKRTSGETDQETENVSETAGSLDTELRITVIAEDGSVEFDSDTEEAGLDNHADRPEVKEAEKNGSGYAVRHSDTLDSDMYYYAMRMNNGDILRVSKAEASIWRMFSNTIRGIVGIGFLMFLVCLFLARYITRGIVQPIEKLADSIDSAEEIDAYEELVPFITTIQRQHEDIMRGAKMRQEFTANVSHELKTPLTSISGYAELIETGIAGENEVQRFAGEIHRNSRRLLTLINDIIRLSELDSDQIEPVYTELDLYDIACTCVEMLTLNAESHGITITCRGFKSPIRANREMMEELLFNLCDNAIRYNRPGGSVEVSVAASGGRACLTVRDTGIGIPKESQDRIFERFYRVDKSRSKQTGGTGLGLAIVKHIVVRHQAKLELKSEVGKGTEITVLFPENSLL